MMGRSIVILGTLGWLSLPVIAAHSLFAAEGPQKVHHHMMLGLIPCLLVVFSHSWILIYLAGTASIIRQAINGTDCDQTMIEEAERLKRHTRSWLYSGILFTLGTFLAGALHWYGLWEIGIHRILFGGALFTVALALWRSWGALGQSEIQIGSVNRWLEASKAENSSSP